MIVDLIRLIMSDFSKQSGQSTPNSCMSSRSCFTRIFFEVHVWIELSGFFEGADSIISFPESFACQFSRCPSHQVLADFPLDTVNVITHLVKWANFVCCAPFVDPVLDFLSVCPLILLNR